MIKIDIFDKINNCLIDYQHFQTIFHRSTCKIFHLANKLSLCVSSVNTADIPVGYVSPWDDIGKQYIPEEYHQTKDVNVLLSF